MFHIYFLPCIIFVIESIPKRDVLQIKRVSIIFGAGTQHIVQYIDMPIQVIHPINPHTLFALNPQWWRDKCSAVMQDGYIFSDTIARNIVPKDVEIDRQRLEYAVRMANAHDTVMALPLKYDTFIGDEGQGLSAGQKQRLLIARAVYKDVPFVFLDEATNSLDAKNEKAITENMQSFYEGKTVIVIAHRMSTVMNADQIIVMDAGKIVETGTHRELVESRSYYYDLIRNQLDLG